MARNDVVELVLRLKSPLFHGGDEKTGSETLFRRLKVFHEGKLVEIPFVSGNAVRGVMRRLVFRDMLERIGYAITSLKLYHALFSGGVLEQVEEGSTSLDIELRRRIRELIPPISLLGTAIGNQVIEGKLKVMHLLPICREASDYLPDWVLSDYNDYVKVSCYELLDWMFHTRRAEEKRKSKEEQAVQMLYRFEVLVPGTRLYTRIICTDCSELELATLTHMLWLFKAHGFIGGKSSTGYGRFEVESEVATFKADPKLYLRHLEERKEEIVALLKELEKRVK